MIKMEVLGSEALIKAMNNAGLNINRTFAAALVAGCFVISNDAKDRCRWVTGNAKRSVHIWDKYGDITPIQPESDGTTSRAMPVTAGVVARTAVDLEKGLQVELIVGTNVWYTWGLEFIHGFPFLRPALDENRREVNAEIKRALQSALRKKGLRG